MGTQLIMTVGTNALPVWVAWYHLKDELDNPVVRFIYTEATESEKNLLQTHCTPAIFGPHIQTSPGNPSTVRGNIRQNILVGLDENTTHLHVHYTGGTQVMGVETVSAIEKRLVENPRVSLDTTYLDARGTRGPCLISRAKVIRQDARMGINVDMERIALLNGFTLAPFEHEYYDRDEKRWIQDDPSAPAQLDQNQKMGGEKVLNIISSRRDPWNVSIEPTDFEYAAYVALKQVLTTMQRTNYRVYHKVYVKRTGANIRDPEFELDVVAILGYQIVVVSCTLENRRAAIKEKGMEVILRARQLGGDEAQAIVLCKGHPQTARDIQKELHDEVGSAGLPLQIWGTDKWRNLQTEFSEYLRALYWQ